MTMLPAAALPILRDAFLEHLEVLAYSPYTIQSYRGILTRFIAWCEEQHAGLDRKGLEGYRLALFKRGVAARTQALHVEVLRSFCRYLVREGEIDADPSSTVEPPRLPPSTPKHVLSPADVERVLAAPDLTTPLGVRDRAVLELFHSTGVRRAELAGLGIDDVDVAAATVHVRAGKGGRSRVVPVGDRALAFVSRYLHEVRPTLARRPTVTTLFLTERGEDFSLGYLSKLVAGYLHEAGLGDVGACHIFRHTVGTSMLEGGAELRFIQAMLGHATLTTTEIYTHVSTRKLAEVHRATHHAGA